MPFRRSFRPARPGHPPNRAADRRKRPPSPAAAGRSRGAVERTRLGVAPHDQSVLPVVRVVAAPLAACFEARLLVELDRDVIRDSHLEHEAAAYFPRGLLE